MKVVLAGSRKLNFLPLEIKDELEKLISSSSEFLVGDSNGVDLSFQKFLNEKNCRDVVVFSSAGYIRNNVGSWDFAHIKTPLKSISSDRHAFKDRRMCELADFGIMVWDTESAGTLSNVFDLVGQGKKCALFNLLENELVEFQSYRSLISWCDKYPQVSNEALRRLTRYAKRKMSLVADDTSQETLF